MCSCSSCRERFHAHLLAQLVCPGRHTLTSLITTGGRPFADWTADYALYAKQRADPGALFSQVRREIEAMNPPSQPLVVALDDTILRKTGKKIPGAAHRKDPLGPPFNINLVWAQRMIQYSAAVPGPNGEARMIPIAFQDASTPRKPRKNAGEEEVAAYRETMGQRNLNALAIAKLAALQEERTVAGEQPAPLHVVVDGSYTNRKVLRQKSSETVVIGRIRKDAHLNAKPDLPLAILVQEYIWRWDIEVNHRDEKTILGVGQAQVRNANSVESVPAAAVAAYAMLHVAAMKAYGWNGKPNTIPPAKWRNPKKKKRASTQDLVNELRRELWSESINPSHLTDFMNRNPSATKSVKSETDLCSAILASSA